MTRLTSCTIDIETYHEPTEENYSYNPQYKLVIRMPLPGGEAVYDIKITKQQANSFEFAHKLSEQIK